MNNRYGLEIRAANGSDIPGLVDLMTADGLSIAAHTLAEWLDALQHDAGAVLIALEWGPPSGLVVVRWFRSLEADQPIAEITTLLVGPDDRRRGIGRLLLKAAARSARLLGSKTLRLCAGSNHAGLRAFCSANGFEEGATCFVRPLRKRGSQADD